MTRTLKAVQSEATKDDVLKQRLEHWTGVMREKEAALKLAIGEWQAKHLPPSHDSNSNSNTNSSTFSPSSSSSSSSPSAHNNNGSHPSVTTTPHLSLAKLMTTGFLDGTHPIVDCYELKVRLDHMLRRLRVLEEAATAQAPAQVLPGLFVGGAVAADSHALLRHLGITHIVNATREVLPPPEEAGFQVLVFPLRDIDEEDISMHFQAVAAFIDEGRGRPPKVRASYCYVFVSPSYDLCYFLHRFTPLLSSPLPALHFPLFSSS